jgi:hypothetical protein
MGTAFLTKHVQVSLLAGADLWHTAAIDRLEIPSVKVRNIVTLLTPNSMIQT